MMSGTRRVAVLWEHLAGYVQASLRAVAALDRTELLVVQRSREPHAAFARLLGDSCEVIDLTQADRGNAIDLVARVRAFAPDVTLVTANGDPRYAAVARANHAEGRITVWGSDVPPRSWWRDSYGMARGRLGALRPYDAAFVPGRAGHDYARRIGFADSRIFEGLYACDTELFRPVGVSRHASGTAQAWPPVFLFAGQFIPRKGLDTLLAAYRRYRQHSAAPWDLWCVGAGPLRSYLDGETGVRVLDFVPPLELAQLMAQAGVFVLPSHMDHWGVVIHEAACAGLPIIASRTAYASLDLVRDGSNGHTFPAGDATRLEQLLTTCAEGDTARTMGARSLELSSRFDPAVFAQVLTERIPRMIK
jgi:glycosyltransferase involved in cell wall biosynthesis